ncbi:MAG: hypothetical protein LBR08_10910 [Bacteroidales bacterium]|jgi:hypothetical protein|nr:hypothetical protein [Bacteroidales bacterium]
MRRRYEWKRILWAALLLLVAAGCATYRMKNLKLYGAIETGDFETADRLLEKDGKTSQGKNRLLYYLNRGYVSWMLSDFAQSVRFFNTAEDIIDAYSVQVASEALALVTNPMMKPYQAEDFEKVMVNCFKAVNYMQLGQPEEAMVECRRINMKLNALNDKYKDHKNRYQRDAFAHVLMGLLYDAGREYNNAFIAYRNALETYESDYVKNFNMQPPGQLKSDLLRTAYLSGFYEEVAFYERKFGVKYTPQEPSQAEMVFFWMNGFGPFKDEWSVNFTILKGQGGMVTFANEELGISLPFFTGTSGESSSFSDLKFVRVAFPKYVERPPLSHSAVISANRQEYPLEPAENINAIAFKTLNDRFLREMGSALLRIAAKQAMEEVTRSQDGNIGALVGIANALTEKADTRNWQTLPYGISYARIPLTKGNNRLILKVKMTDGRMTEHELSVEALEGQTRFHAFHSLN